MWSVYIDIAQIIFDPPPLEREQWGTFLDPIFPSSNENMHQIYNSEFSERLPLLALFWHCRIELKHRKNCESFPTTRCHIWCTIEYLYHHDKHRHKEIITLTCRKAPCTWLLTQLFLHPTQSLWLQIFRGFKKDNLSWLLLGWPRNLCIVGVDKNICKDVLNLTIS